MIAWALSNDVAELEASADAEAAWVDTVVARSAASADRAKSCTPGYYNREGQANAKTRQGSFFFGTPTEYADILRGIAGARHTGRVRDPHRYPSMTRRGRYLTGRVRALTRRGRSPRVVIIGAGFGGLAAAVALRRKGHRRPVDRRAVRRRRWHLATEHLSGCGVRHPEPPVFVFVRAQPQLDPHLRLSAGDPVRTSSRSPTTSTCAATSCSAPRVREADLERTGAPHWDVELADGRSARRGRRRQRGRVVRRRRLSRHRGPHRVFGRADAHRAVGRERRPDRQAGGGRSAPGQVVCRSSPNSPTHDRSADGVSAHAAVDGAEGGPTVQQLRSWRGSAGDPWAALRERWRLWKMQHDNTALTPDHPRMAAGSGVVGELSATRMSPTRRLRDALTPRYPFRCKRVLLGEKYYAALQYPHVDLVTDPIERVTETAVVTAGGRVVDVDAIVLATGFETSNYLSGLEVIGVGGQSLHDLWGQDPRAYLGVAVSGFPELLHAVRAQHQPGCQLDHLHPGSRRAHGGQCGEPIGQARRPSRRATRGRITLQRTDFRGAGAHDLDTMRQLLPIAQRTNRHAVAALGTRLRPGDLANTVSRLASPDLTATGLFRCRAASRRLLGGRG